MGDLQVALRRGATLKKMALRALLSLGDLEIAAPNYAIWSGVPSPNKDEV